MYVTVRNYVGNREVADALVRNESEVRRIITEVEGFRAYYLVRTSDGDALSISVYDDSAGAERSTEVAAEWIRENLSDMSIEPPKVSVGEAVLTF